MHLSILVNTTAYHGSVFSDFLLSTKTRVIKICLRDKASAIINILGRLSDKTI